MLDEFIQTFGDLSCSVGEEIQCSQGREGMVRLLLEMAAHPPAKKKTQHRRIENLTLAFLDRFEKKQRGFASDLLDLGRASYRLRDDDNIYLGRIERQVAEATEEGRRRLETQGRLKGDVTDPKELVETLKNPAIFRRHACPLKRWRYLLHSSPGRSLANLQVPALQRERHGSS